MDTVSTTSFARRKVPLLMVTVSFLVSVIGILLSVYSVSYVFTHGTTATGVLLALLTAILCALLVAGCGWILVTDFTLEEMVRIGCWAFGGVVLFEFILLLIWYYGIESGQPFTSLDLTAPALLSIGVVAGFLTGINSIHRANAARAARERLEQIEFVNSILRHEILNSHTVIHGHAALLSEKDHVDGHDALETIVERSESVTARVESIRSLIELINAEEDDLARIDLIDYLTQEIATANASYRTAAISVETDLPDELWVEGNALLGSLFENLIGNAIQHDPAPTPELIISLTVEDKFATVTFEDSGPGLPSDLVMALEDPISDGSTLLEHGYGLYIVRTVVDKFGGTIGVTENVSGGTSITVELPRADGHESTVMESR